MHCFSSITWLCHALHSFQYASINRKRRFSASARIPSSTICLFQYGLSSTMVQSIVVQVSVSSTMKVSHHAFGFASLAFEPVTPTNSSAKEATEVQASAVKTNSNNALPFGGISNKSFDYTSLFGDKPSFTYWLVVASEMKILKAKQMTALQSSILSQMTILQLKCLCSFASQQFQLSPLL